MVTLTRFVAMPVTRGVMRSSLQVLLLVVGTAHGAASQPQMSPLKDLRAIGTPLILPGMIDEALRVSVTAELAGGVTDGGLAVTGDALSYLVLQVTEMSLPLLPRDVHIVRSDAWLHERGQLLRASARPSMPTSPQQWVTWEVVRYDVQASPLSDDDIVRKLRELVQQFVRDVQAAGREP